MASASAVEVPGSGAFVIQTNGPNTPMGRGDFYTSSAGGGGYHYVQLTIACGWPSSIPVVVELFSPEMVQSVAVANGGSEEFTGALDNTEFELYGPGVSPGPGAADPGPAAVPLVRTLYPPKLTGGESWENFATIPAPVACGNYTVRAETKNDDQNGWRIRVGADLDGDISTAPTDDFDGVPGTDDEIILGLSQVTYQQDSGSPRCFSVWEFIPPRLASVAVNNFDYDGYDYPSGAEVSYTSPSGVVTNGTVSVADATWNGSNSVVRGGDILTNPEGGWWKFTSCMASGNQFIQEAVQNTPSYVTQPPTPRVTLVKTDGQTNVARNQQLTYTITASNIANGPTRGAATSVHIEDTMPAGLAFNSCAFVAPATGRCALIAGVVVADLAGPLDAGASIDLEVVATVRSLATGTQTNAVTVDYEDSFGHTFPTVTATDIDAIPAGTGTIGDLVFLDLDGDSVRDPGEPGIAGVTVSLTGPGGIVTQDTTDANGVYGFAGLYSGAYSAAITAGAPGGTSGTLGSSGYSIVLANGQTRDDLDFGYVGLGSIGSFVWLDSNENGVKDAAESPIAGVDMSLQSDGTDALPGTPDDISLVAATDSQGGYLFTGLPPGVYSVSVVAATVPASHFLVSGIPSTRVQLTTLALTRLDVNLGYQVVKVLGFTGSALLAPMLAIFASLSMGSVLLGVVRWRRRGSSLG